MRRLLQACRETNVEYNRKAYQLFFQVIRCPHLCFYCSHSFHLPAHGHHNRYHAGVMDVIKQHHLKPFLEIPTSAVNGITMNGLHYLARLFSLVQVNYSR
jgi:hypothetical protein